MTSNRHHNTYIDGAVCFWTSSIVNYLPIFKSRTACFKAIETLDKCRTRYEVKLLGYVIVPEHIHLAIWAQDSAIQQTFIRQFLKITSADIAALASKAANMGDLQAADWYRQFEDGARQSAKVRVWKEGGRAFPVTTEAALRQKLNYIHQNPVRRGLASRAEDWSHSSAGYYAGSETVIAIDEFSF